MNKLGLAVSQKGEHNAYSVCTYLETFPFGFYYTLLLSLVFKRSVFSRDQKPCIKNVLGTVCFTSEFGELFFIRMLMEYLQQDLCEIMSLQSEWEHFSAFFSDPEQCMFVNKQFKLYKSSGKTF